MGSVSGASGVGGGGDPFFKLVEERASRGEKGEGSPKEDHENKDKESQKPVQQRSQEERAAGQFQKQVVENNLNVTVHSKDDAGITIQGYEKLPHEMKAEIQKILSVAKEKIDRVASGAKQTKPTGPGQTKKEEEEQDLGNVNALDSNPSIPVSAPASRAPLQRAERRVLILQGETLTKKYIKDADLEEVLEVIKDKKRGWSLSEIEASIKVLSKNKKHKGSLDLYVTDLFKKDSNNIENLNLLKFYFNNKKLFKKIKDLPVIKEGLKEIFINNQENIHSVVFFDDNKKYLKQILTLTTGKSKFKEAIKFDAVAQFKIKLELLQSLRKKKLKSSDVNSENVKFLIEDPKISGKEIYHLVMKIKEKESLLSPHSGESKDELLDIINSKINNDHTLLKKFSKLKDNKLVELLHTFHNYRNSDEKIITEKEKYFLSFIKDVHVLGISKSFFLKKGRFKQSSLEKASERELMLTAQHRSTNKKKHIRELFSAIDKSDLLEGEKQNKKASVAEGLSNNPVALKLLESFKDEDEIKVLVESKVKVREELREKVDQEYTEEILVEYRNKLLGKFVNEFLTVEEKFYKDLMAIRTLLGEGADFSVSPSKRFRKHPFVACQATNKEKELMNSLFVQYYDTIPRVLDLSFHKKREDLLALIKDDSQKSIPIEAFYDLYGKGNENQELVMYLDALKVFCKTFESLKSYVVEGDLDSLKKSYSKKADKEKVDRALKQVKFLGLGNIISPGGQRGMRLPMTMEEVQKQLIKENKLYLDIKKESFKEIIIFIDSRIINLDYEIKEKQKEIELQKELQEQHKKINAQLNLQKTDCQKSIEEKKSTIENSSKKLIELQIKSKKSVEEKNEITQRHKEVEKSFTQEKSQKIQERAKITQEHEKRIEELLKNKKNKLQKKQQELESKIVEYKTKTVEETKKLQSEKENYKKLVEDKAKKTLDKKIKKREKDLGILNKELSKLESQMQKLKEKKDKLYDSKVIKKEQGTFSKLKQAVSQKISEIDSQIKKESAHFSTQLEKIKEESSTINNQITENQALVKRYQEELSVLESDLGSLASPVKPDIEQDNLLGKKLNELRDEKLLLEQGRLKNEQELKDLDQHIEGEQDLIKVKAMIAYFKQAAKQSNEELRNDSFNQ